MIPISGHTTLISLLGSPVSHSISPAMHNEAFHQLGLDYVYLAFDIKPENLKTAIDGMRTLHVRGFNLTMPHKQAVLEYCDHLSLAARLTGSVNTVVNEAGVLTGHTTDGIGYMQSVKEAGLDIIGKTVTLIGAGGASTSILAQAALDGVKRIHVFNRPGKNYDRVQKLISDLKPHCACEIFLYDLADAISLNHALAESVLLINGTSVGMAPDTDASVITDTHLFHKELVVSDVIYNPRETLLLRQAKAAGCQTFNGLHMLLYQGAEAFKLWTGREMPVDIVKEKYFK